MAKQRQIWTIIAVLLSLLAAAPSWAASISGTLTNASAKTGRAYIMLKDQYGNSNGFGTSLAIASGSGSTPFTLKGIPAGQYQLDGYLDTRANDPLARGHIFSGDPLFGSSSTITVSSGDVSGLNYTISAAPAQSVVTPASIDVAPMANGLFVFFDTPTNSNNIEIADTYNIYWSTSTNPSATQTTGGGSIIGIPSTDDGHQGITGLVNGTAYYVAVEAVLGGVKSGLATTGQVPAGNPAGGYTLSGAVNFSGIVPANPLYIVAYADGGQIYLARISSPTAGQSFTIQGVQPGTYGVFAFLDQNGNSRIDSGDLSSGFDTLTATVQGNTSLPAITVVNQDVFSGLTTQHSNYGQDNYYLNFRFEGRAKQPAHIVVNGGPNMGETSMGINNWGEFALSYQVPKPAVGDSYSATVYFTDNTSTTVSNLTVSGRIDVLPTVTFPVGQTGINGTSPRFAWYLNGLPTGDYSQNLQLYSQEGDGWERSVPITQNSYQYDGQTLSTGTNYNGRIEIRDSFGNVSESGIQFQPTANQLTVTGVSPSTLPCGSTTPVIISGTGFNTANPSNNLVYFNSNTNPAQVNSATYNQLSVTLPSCTSGIVSTGPVRVSNGSASAALNGDFIPQIFYDYYVKNSSNTALSGVTVSVDGNPAIASTSDVNGHYILSGIPSGLPFQQKLTGSGYLASYSGRTLLFNGLTDTSGNFGLFTASEAAAWGVTTDMGVIRSRVADNSGVNMAGAVVSAYSTRYNSSSHYTVSYTDPANAAQLVTGTATHTDGRYYVLNVEEGDTVVVTALKSTYTFNKRTFVTHADAVSQGRVTGTPTVSVTGISPAAAPTGSTITINGNNFNTNTGQTSVCFQINFGGTSCTNPVSATTAQLIVTLPCGSVSGPVTLTSNGQTVNAGTFTVPSPVITGFSPLSGSIGAPVTITGTNFSNGNCSWESMVSFAGQQYQQVTGTSSTQIVFNTPYVINTTTGTISVTTPAGTASSSASFTVYPNPTTTGYMNPTMAAPGESVTLSGTFYDFTASNYQISVGGFTATVTSVTADALVFTVPANVGFGGQVSGYYFNSQLYGQFLTIVYRLSAAITGNGSVNSTNGLGGLTCTPSGCSGNFYYNEFASLAATPSTGYSFSGWSGDCGGTGNCDMNMTANKAVTATFSIQQNIKNGSIFYGSIVEAFAAQLFTNDSLMLRSLTFVENPVFNVPGVAITIKGGYNAGYASNSGNYSILDGTLTIQRGSLVVEKLAIQ